MELKALRSSSSGSPEKPHTLSETPNDKVAAPTEPTQDEDVETAAEETASPPRTTMQNALIMTSICMATFLAALDSTLLTTALPTIASSFHASDSGFAWIGSVYLLANGTSMPFWGKISDIFGRKPIFMTANVVFMVGSLIAALSKSLNMLLAGRAIQGLGAGGLMNLSNIVVSDLFSLRDRGLYLALVGATWSFATAIGPVIGGVFSQSVSWRWCFWINLPADGAALVLLFFLLKVHNPRTPLIEGLKAMDWLGALTIAGGTVMFLLGLQFGGVTYPWGSAVVICLLVFGLFTVGVFILLQWKVSKSPLIPLRILNNWYNIAVLVLSVAHAFCYIAVAYFIPLYFQAALGATPLQSGVWFLAMAGVMAFILISAGVYVKTTGRYLDVIRFGFFFLTLSIGLFIDFPPYRSWSRIITFQILVGLGIGPLFQAPLIALQANLKPGDLATGSSTFGFSRVLTTSISVVVGQVIFQSGMHKRLDEFLKVGIPSNLAATLAEGDAVAATFTIDKLTSDQKHVVSAAITDSLSKMWIFYAVIAGVGLLASFGIGRMELSKVHVETKTGLKKDEEEEVQPGSMVEKEIV